MQKATTMAIDIRPILDTPMLLGESPLWHESENALYWIDIAAMAVHRFHPSSRDHKQWPLPAQPGCIAKAASGGLIVAMRSGLAHLDTLTGSLEMLSPAPYDTKDMRFNDGRCDAAGRLWAGAIYEPRTNPNAPLYRIERGAISDTGIRATVSNGVAFSPDNQTLYHADTTAHTITAYDYTLSSGQIGGSRILKKFNSDKRDPDYGGRPDGAAVDAEGAYWCAMFEGGRILRLSPSGEVLREILLPLRCPTMLAFGGPALRTLYITSASENRSPTERNEYPLTGHVLTLTVDVAGRLEPDYVR